MMGALSGVTEDEHPMALAFGALEPLTLAAAASNSAVLVAAAGVVVVLAILLVFVMVLRGNSSTRQQRGSGLDYDAQRGPIGQPQAPAGGPDAARSRVFPIITYPDQK